MWPRDKKEEDEQRGGLMIYYAVRRGFETFNFH